LSVLNYDKTIYKDTAGNVIVDGSKLTGFFNPVGNMTPLGTALLNVGQYFSSKDQFDKTLLGLTCGGKTCQSALFNESSAGDVKAPWAYLADGTTLNPNQCSICWACQNNAVVVISDGTPNSEISIPSIITASTKSSKITPYDSTQYFLASNCGSKGTACGNAVFPHIAGWLKVADLRNDAVLQGKQALTVHTVGINIDKVNRATAYAVLNAAATLSGGIFQSASDPKELANAVMTAINQVLPKENSFSAASATSLQTVQTAASQAFLTRFKPNQTPTWEGHVYETFLFDEFLNSCDSTQVVQKNVTCQGKTVSADFNGDGKCGGVFMIDSDCDEIAEDSKTGDFVKKGTGLPANVAWDAGKVLSTPTATGYKSADETASNARNIFTYINGVKVPFTAANAATIQPYMNISATWCSAFLTQLGITAGASPTLQCAQQLIYFVRGWDTLNQDSDTCWGPGNPKNTTACKSGTKGEERDRPNDGPVGCTYGTTCTDAPIFWKLGDIFHSSPAIMLVPSDEIRCDTGYDSQCVATLHSPSVLPGQTPIEYYALSGTFKVDAYERYRRDKITRKRVVLVGANDGMLHAFDAGDPDTSKAPDITGSYPYTVGTGSELWAFIPPDLLPRLKDLKDNHQYMVDGSVMLRDVWVDGTGTEVTAADRKKQRDEYRTMAIFGRRAGGTAYSALDVTDPANPVLKWSFPKDCSEDARFMGESWSDFSPRPPPIFPVRIKDTGDSRGFAERWVVGINGGYDPMLNQGRAMFMLDVWTGTTLWRYTDADFKADTGYGAGTSMFPIPAAMAPVDIGDPTKPVRDMDGFFDTATWGDLGGNLWVARFYEPGEIDATTGRVKNWFVARAFEQQRQADDSQKAAGRNEFFYMTANSFESTNRTLRTYLGSGNRERIMNQSASCGTDNLLACAQAGCTKVTSTTTNNYGACNGTTTFSAINGTYSYATSTTATCGAGAATCASGANFSSTLNAHWECPGSGAILDAAGSASCDASGLCTVTPMPERNISGTFNAMSHNRFYGVWSYGRDTKKMFRDKATALVFDKNRFTDIPLASTCSGPRGSTCTLVDTTTAKVSYDTSNPLLFNTACGTGVTKCSASVEDAGWFYEYGRECPLASCAVAPPWTDEKTGSGATVLLGCTLWGAFRPVGVTTGTNPCEGTLGTPVAYGYTTHYVSGTPNPTQCGSITLATQRSITSPPNPPINQVTFFGGASGGGGGSGSPPGTPGSSAGAGGCGSGGGGISYSALNIDPGSAANKTQIGTRTCAMEPIYWLEVPREVHDCRHRPVTPGNPSTCD
jgi:type IV pilus assembly protein PilY1